MGILTIYAVGFVALGLWGLWIALHVLLLVRAGIYAIAIERRKDAIFA